jgi:hypothetical protein
MVSREFVEQCIAEVNEIVKLLTFENTPEEIEYAAGRIVGRLGLIVMMVNSLAEREVEPPSMWIGKIAGLALESEVMQLAKDFSEQIEQLGNIARNN